MEQKTKILSITGIVVIIAVALISGCVEVPEEPTPTNDTTVTSEAIAGVVNANNQFAFDLYSKYKDKEGNIFFSPYSILTALSMTYEGAKGKTAEEMKNVLHLPDDKEKIHSDFVKLNENLNKQNESYNLSVANALWAQKGYKFLDEYFNTIEQYYNGKVTNLDFIGDTENSRITINKWIENQTNDKIKDLISKGDLNEWTRLVLTNAIYFKGTWKWEFNESDTYDEDFHITPNTTVKVKMMHMKPDKARFNYIGTDKLQILELPYKGDNISMLILLPRENYTLKDIDLSYEKFNEYKSQMKETKLDGIYIPKFNFTTKYYMRETLSAMGMPTAFSMNADFSGMDGKKDLFISKVIHQAFVDVNEKGTEAAAATAVIIKKTGTPTNIFIFRADRPFIFIIQNKETENILFLGRVADPSKN